MLDLLSWSIHVISYFLAPENVQNQKLAKIDYVRIFVELHCQNFAVFWRTHGDLVCCNGFWAHYCLTINFMS